MIFLTDAALIALTMLMVALLGLGGARGARLGGRDARAARMLGGSIVLVMLVWLAITWAVARSGVLGDWTARPPRWPFLPLTGLFLFFGLGQTSPAKSVIGVVPRSWLVAAQSFRIAVELLLFALFATGRAPRQVTFEGSNFDVFIGLSAPVMAWLLARERISPGVLRAWNVLGLLILADTVRVVATSTPGPLHLPWPGEPFTALATWPVVWLPAFLVPLAVSLHIASLRSAGAHHSSLPLVKGDSP